MVTNVTSDWAYCLTTCIRSVRDYWRTSSYEVKASEREGEVLEVDPRGLRMKLRRIIVPRNLKNEVFLRKSYTNSCGNEA